MSKKALKKLKELSPKKKELIELAKSLIENGSKAAGAISHAHPVTIALLLIAGANLGHIIVPHGTPEEQNSYAHQQLTVIHNTSLMLGSAAAAAQIVPGALNLVGQYLGRQA